MNPKHKHLKVKRNPINNIQYIPSTIQHYIKRKRTNQLKSLKAFSFSIFCDNPSVSFFQFGRRGKLGSKKACFEYIFPAKFEVPVPRLATNFVCRVRYLEKLGVQSRKTPISEGFENISRIHT